MNPIIPDSQPAPSRGSTAIAAGILASGYGPEKIAYIIEGFRCADEMEQEIATAMTVLQAARAPEPGRPRVRHLRAVPPADEGGAL